MTPAQVVSRLHSSSAGATPSDSCLHLQEGHQKKELAWPSAAAMAGMAALCLWRGFKEDE